MELREMMLRKLIACVPAATEGFDERTGRFLTPEGGWTPTNQDVILPLALLYVTEHGDNPYHGDARALELARRGGDALRDVQDGAGRIEFVKPDGTRWGWQYMPWPLYHWLEAFRLLRPHLGGARSGRWEAGLRLAYSGIAEQLRALKRVHNIPLWHAVGLVRAGQTFDNPEWIRIGSARALDAPEHAPEGFWSEGGPTTAYNLVYVHALGLYHAFTQDPAVLPALERALDFHLHFTYPDGKPVETIDGRVSYRDMVALMGLPGFLPFPAGRRYARFLLDRWQGPRGTRNHMPHLAAAALCPMAETSEAQIPQEKDEFVSNFHHRAIVRRQGPWFICISGYVHSDETLAEGFRARFRLDRQNYLSIWHESSGLLVGGGNSKFHPQVSTFSMLQGRERWVQAEAAQLTSDGDTDSATYRYGCATCCLRVRILDRDAVEISIRAEGGPCRELRGGLTMPLRHGQRLISSRGGEAFVVHPRRYYGQDWSGQSETGDRWVAGEGWRLMLPPGCGTP